MATTVRIVFFFIMSVALATTMTPGNVAGMATTPPLDCNSKCGDVDVLYPFGMKDDVSKDCYFHWLGSGVVNFNLTCNSSFSPPKPFLGSFEVTSIDLFAGQVTVLFNISYACYNSSGIKNHSFSPVDLQSSPYTVSNTENVFMAVGCETSAEFEATYGTGYGIDLGGCIPECSNKSNAHNGSCSGVGCCQTWIPLGTNLIYCSLRDRRKNKETYSLSPCSYSFLVQKNGYKFSTSDLMAMDTRRSFPVILDFIIRNQTCDEAKADNNVSYACTNAHSECADSPSRNGYFCKCSPGYEGNPYLPDGCTDIDECKLSRDLYPCYGVCTNLPGGYDCSCPPGSYSLDPKKSECISKPTTEKAKLPLGVLVAIGIGVGTLLLLFIGALCCLEFQRRKMNRLKKKNFENHGGYFLQQLIAIDRSKFEIFSMGELRRATNNFHQDQILGSGGFGTVYKGILNDQRLIAIKKSIIVNEKNGRDFANELFILSKVNHKNIVQLLGCCLEDEVPLLVYEYIPKGTLYDFIHGRSQQRIPIATRLRIATETAEALKYLHIDASTPILHGDIKSANILLDEDYVAKLSDFGTSKLAPKDKKQFTTLVQGTCGYLDPEYMLIGYLTAQSDVYSFGVVLVELMTRKLPFNFDAEPEHKRSLASKFITCMENDRLHEILDPDIIERGSFHEVGKVLDLATRCLSLKANERPTMKEVLSELQGLKVLDKRHPWSPANYDDTCSLLGGMNGASFDLSSHGTLDIETEGGRGR